MAAEHYTRPIKTVQDVLLHCEKWTRVSVLGKHKSHYAASFRGFAVLHIIIRVSSGHLDDMNVIRIWRSSKCDDSVCI